MLCPYCMEEAEWVSNKEVYGKERGRSHMIYLCRNCDAYVGCHKNTMKPLGIMANKNLRIMRVSIHRIINPIWEDKKLLTKEETYRMLDKWWGKEFHTAWLREWEAKKVLDTLDIDKLVENYKKR